MVEIDDLKPGHEYEFVTEDFSERGAFQMLHRNHETGRYMLLIHLGRTTLGNGAVTEFSMLLPTRWITAIHEV